MAKVFVPKIDDEFYDEKNGRTLIVRQVRTDSKTAWCQVSEYLSNGNLGIHLAWFTFRELKQFMKR